MQLSHAFVKLKQYRSIYRYLAAAQNVNGEVKYCSSAFQSHKPKTMTVHESNSHL